MTDPEKELENLIFSKKLFKFSEAKQRQWFFLLAERARSDLVDEIPETSLSLLARTAIAKDSFEVFREAFRKGLKLNEDFLCQAVHFRSLKIVEFLLSQGVTASQEKLTEAAKETNSEILKLLSRHNLDVRGAFKEALHRACVRHDSETVLFLMKEGSLPSEKDLLLAAGGGMLQVLKEYKKRTGELQVDQLSEEAALRNQPETLLFLLQEGAEPTKTLKRLSKVYGSLPGDCVGLLLAFGADEGVLGKLEPESLVRLKEHGQRLKEASLARRAARKRLL